MFREHLTADSSHVAVLVTGSGRCDVKYRTPAYPESACDLGDRDTPGKNWVRLVRRGNTFTTWTRADGQKSWRRLKDVELTLPSSVYVGLAVTAHDDAQLATATFDGVSVRSGP
jgi:hypothetical protein